MRIVAISGSLRKASYNTTLLRTATELAPAGVEIAIASIRDFPLYDGDLEAAQGVPAAVSALKDTIAAADGLLVATPEYNGGIPGVFKNAIDWLSRPAKDIRRVFGDLPFGMIGATPTRAGTRMAQQAWLQPLRQLGVHLWTGGSLYLAEATNLFGAGALVDPTARKLLATYVDGFVTFVDHNRRGGR